MAKYINPPEGWRLLADRDFTVANHLAVKMAPIPTEIIAFHCQQAVEKYLKGVLVITGEEPPYIHDLPKLCKLAERHHPAFISISSLCSVITHFSTQSRYDSGLSLSEADMQIVLANTKTIRDFLQKEIPELFN